jgi:hypothetical protein
MNKLIYKILPVLFVLIISCEQDDTTDGVSRITQYNDIELIGDQIIVLSQGTAFVDPGVIAFEGEEDVTEKVEVSGSVDNTEIGYNELSYNIVNKDGFAKTITRTVLVVPSSVSSIDYSGTYTGVVSTGTHLNATVITKIANGVFEASDFFGGRYNIGYGYGPAYRLKTYFYVNADNTTYTSLWNNSPWGPWFFINMKVSGTTFSHKVISTPDPASFGFDVTLIKQ